MSSKDKQEHVTVNVQTGEAKVPQPDGSTQTEMKNGVHHASFMDETFSNTPEGQKRKARFLHRNGEFRKAAEVMGQEYKEGFFRSIGRHATSNKTPLEIAGITLVTGGVIYGAQLGIRKTYRWIKGRNQTEVPVAEVKTTPLRAVKTGT